MMVDRILVLQVAKASVGDTANMGAVTLARVHVPAAVANDL